jgi:putative addiction module component (TIGR02574 family)
MDVPTLIRELRALDPADRARVFEAVAEDADMDLSALLSPEQIADLDRRIAADEADPDAGEPWEVVKARLQSKS